MSYKYRFFDDYSEGAHPNILDALNKTNLDQETGYGDDSFCIKAAEVLNMLTRYDQIPQLNKLQVNQGDNAENLLKIA